MKEFDKSKIFKDNPLGDIEIPPHDEAILIKGKRGKLYSTFMLAGGDYRRPTVLLLRGFPGNEKMLDLGFALRRAGANVLTFHYSGSWGSEGKFSYTNVIEDANTALDFLLDENNAECYHIERTKIFVIGHSMGGFAALHLAGFREEITATITLAPYDFRGMYELGINGDERIMKSFNSLLKNGADWLNTSYEKLMDNVKSHPEISLTKLTPDLARRRLRIIGASYDKTALTKYNAERIAKYIESNNPVDFEYSEIQTTHCFIDRRLEMIKIVAGILETWINM